MRYVKPEHHNDWGRDIAEMEHAMLPGLHEQPHAIGPSHPLIESGTGRTTFTLMTALATVLGGHDVYVIMAFEGDVARAHTRMGVWRHWVGLASDTGKALNQMQCLTPATFHRPDDRIVYYDHNVLAPVTHFLDP